MNEQLYDVEDYSHPAQAMHLLLVVGRDGDTLQKRRKTACDTLGVSDCPELVCTVRKMTFAEIEQLEEWGG